MFKKPRLEPKRRGSTLTILALLIAASIFIWVEGQSLELTQPAQRWKAQAIVLSVALLLMLVSGVAGMVMSRLVKRQFDEEHQQAVPEAGASADAVAERGGLAELRDELRATYGYRWRYKLPWLMLTGDNIAISGLLPDFKEQGWLVTADAVLLWVRTGSNGQPDATWLKIVYKLRRRRPIDAVVLVTDGGKDLPTQRRGTDAYGIRLARITDGLRWSAPAYALEVGPTGASSVDDAPNVFCELPRQANSMAIEAALQKLRDQLSARSLAQLPQKGPERYLGKLSQRMDSRGKALADWLAGLASGTRGQQSVRGVAFAPAFAFNGSMDAGIDLPLWQYLAGAAQRQPGRRTAWHPLTICARLALLTVGLWTAGMLVSGLQNDHDLSTAQQAARDIQSAPNAAARLKALDTLQQQIQRYEYRVQHHAPLSMRFGLNRDADILAALWKPYAKASRDILVAPAAENLEATLVDLSQLQTRGLSDETSKWALEGHDTLRAYLMLAHPERVDAAFLAQQLAQHWTTDARITPGQKQDLAERFARFYAEHLKANPDWRIEPRPELIAGARQTLLAVIGQRNAQDTIYQASSTALATSIPTRPCIADCRHGSARFASRLVAGARCLHSPGLRGLRGGCHRGSRQAQAGCQ